jgi:hypothetical protein
VKINRLRRGIFYENYKDSVFPVFGISRIGWFYVYAADQSICHSGANVEFYKDGSLKACRLKKDYDMNSIQCKADWRIVLIWEKAPVFSTKPDRWKNNLLEVTATERVQ